MQLEGLSDALDSRALGQVAVEWEVASSSEQSVARQADDDSVGNVDTRCVDEQAQLELEQVSHLRVHFEQVLCIVVEVHHAVVRKVCESAVKYRVRCSDPT